MNKFIAALGVVGALAFGVPAFAQVATPYYPQPTQYCPSLSFNLYRGLNDFYTQGQVSQLQQFLAARGYYQLVTGYYGAMTTQNVAHFQQQYAIYPVTGGVGPLTRAAIAQQCGGSVPPQPGYGTVTITNVSGPNSLSVGQQGSWSITTNAPYGSYLSTSVRWGDENLYPYPYMAAANTVSQQTSFTHTYSQAGTYTAVFTVTDSAGRSTTANTTVVVGGSSGCTTYPYTNCQSGFTVTSPTAGQTFSRGGQMPISWSGLVYQTFAYQQTAGIVDLYSVQSGKIGTIAIQNGTSGSYTWSIPPFPQTIMCTMQYPNALCGTNIPDGQYYIKVTVVTGSGFDANATQLASANSGTFAMTGTGGGTTGSISASPQSGPVPLMVSFVLNNYSGQYRVDYGDGLSASLVSGSTSHTYYNRGTYTATFISDYPCLHSTPACMIAQQNLGSVTITAY